MGIRAHVQIKQPEYGVQTFWGSAQEATAEFLRKNDFGLWEEEGGSRWEIEITDSLRGLCRQLQNGCEEYEASLPEDIRGQGFGHDFGMLLLEGLEAADKNHYSHINIEWW